MFVDLDDFLTVDENLAAASAVQAGRHVEQGRLATARRPDQRYDLAVTDRKRHPFDSDDRLTGTLAVLKFLGDVAEFQPHISECTGANSIGHADQAPSRAITAR